MVEVKVVVVVLAVVLLVVVVMVVVAEVAVVVMEVVLSIIVVSVMVAAIKSSQVSACYPQLRCSRVRETPEFIENFTELWYTSVPHQCSTS